jgi:TFIIIC subunit triple barrel domain
MPNNPTANDLKKSTAQYAEDIFVEYSVVHPRYTVSTKVRRRRNPETGKLEYPKGYEEPNEGNNTPAVSQDLKSKPNAAGADSDMQIMELHSKNPIISYQGNFYSCKWASALGTDMLFARKSDVSPDSEPLRSLGDWDLVGLGSARLMASHTQVNRRLAATKDTEGTGTTAGNARRTADTGNQASFWDKFYEIRLKKGEIQPPREGSLIHQWETYGSELSPQSSPSKRGGRGGRGGGGGRGPGRSRAARSKVGNSPRDSPGAQSSAGDSVASSSRGPASKRRRT